jgi:hypothetical protein
MAYSPQAHNLMESILQVLKARQKVTGVDAYAYMTGLLMPNIDLATAIRITNMILEMEVDND